MYNTEKKNKSIALKKVAGLTCKEINAFMKSANDVLVTCSGRNGFYMSPALKEKLLAFIEKRKEWNITIAGIFFKDNFEATFIFYVNGNPEDAYYEKNHFFNQSDFETELDNQLQSDFMPPQGSMPHVFYQIGCSLPKDIPMDIPIIYM